MKKYLLALTCLVVAVVSGCGVGANTSHHNNEISGELRSEIHSLNNAILNYLTSGDTGELEKVNLDSTITSEDLRKMQAQLASLVAKAKFTVLDDYFIQYAGAGKTTFPIPSQTDPAFTIMVELENKRPCFVSLVSTQGEFNDLMFTFIYFQIEDTWHLRTFRVGNYMMANRNAVQWYEEAKSMTASNQTIPALLRLQIATGSILRPAPFIQYSKEKEIIDLAKSVQKEVTQNHTFPLTLTKVSGTPSIYYIVPEFVQSELLPMVKYVSSNSLDNKDALQKEAEEMTRVLREMFLGIADYHEYIAFKAFSEPPTDPARTYKAYGITVKVDELDK